MCNEGNKKRADIGTTLPIQQGRGIEEECWIVKIDILWSNIGSKIGDVVEKKEELKRCAVKLL